MAIEVGRITQVFVPMMMKAQLTPGWNALDDRRYNWVRDVRVGCVPASPPSRPRRRSCPSGARGSQMEVKEAAFANAAPRVQERFVQSRLAVDPSARGRSGFRRALTRPLWILMGDGRRRPADRLRERREPAAGARGRTSARDGGAPRARRPARSARAAVARREPAPRLRRRTRRAGAGRCRRAARARLLRQRRRAAAGFDARPICAFSRSPSPCRR